MNKTMREGYKGVQGRGGRKGIRKNWKLKSNEYERRREARERKMKKD